MRNLYLLVAVVILHAESPPLLLAASGPGHVPSIADTFVLWPNFLLFAFLTYYLLKGPFTSLWADREARLREEVNKGKIELANAEEALSEARELFSRADQEAEQLRKKIIAEGEQEGVKLQEEAEDRSQSILAFAESSVEAELQAEEGKLRDEFTERVVVQAEALIRERLTGETDQALRSAAIGQLGRLVSESRSGKERSS